MIPQRIEREILIDAPMDVVWAVVTEPQYMSRWFSDAVELDLRPGGRAALHWEGHGTVHGRVERVEPPHFFSFRWHMEHESSSDLDEGNSTLVEFSLRSEDDSTRLIVVESGFRDLVGTDDERQRHVDGHRRGWQKELGELDEYLREHARAGR
jgi:uncharacterized protein YndB with AHSA1/START domain